jgi:beta-galactosidase
MFIDPKRVQLAGNPYGVDESKNEVHTWMELLTPTTAETFAKYDHPAWGEYAAITGNECGNGYATYIGCIVSSEVMSGILAQALKRASIWEAEQEIRFPIIIKSGVNDEGKTIKFIFNYSADIEMIRYPFEESDELLSEKHYKQGETITLNPWSFMIFELK